MSGFTGLAPLARLALRRDRVLLPVWVAVFVLTAWSSAAATVELYPTADSRIAAAGGINAAPALVAFYGRIYDPSSLGAIAMIKMTGLGAAMVAVLAIVLLVRHTRADEEAGRLELVGAGVVGRQAALGAALLVTLLANLALALFTAAVLAAAGLPVAGSIAFGLAWAATGLAFAGVAAVAVQLATNRRTAVGLSVFVLGAAYLLRAVGDTAGPEGPGWATWLSPIGWSQGVRPYAHERWWVFALLVGFAAVCSAAAFALSAHRDLGAGLLPDRPGPDRAGVGLHSALGLAWRLQRGALLGWAVAFVVLGAVLGGIVTSIDSMLDSPQAREFFVRLGGEKALSDAFLATDLGFVGVCAAAYGIQAAMRLRSEEQGLRAEPLLAAAVGRVRWTLSHTLIALLGSAVLVGCAGLAAGVSYALATDDPGQVGRVLAAALVQIPAVWVLTGLVVAVFGLLPRAAMAGWAALVGFLLIAEVGPLLQVDQLVLDLSPFAHVPRMPGAPFTAVPLLWLLAVAGALLAAGLVGVRRRDVG